MAIFEVLKINL